MDLFTLCRKNFKNFSEKNFNTTLREKFKAWSQKIFVFCICTLKILESSTTDTEDILNEYLDFAKESTDLRNKRIQEISENFETLKRNPSSEASKKSGTQSRTCNVSQLFLLSLRFPTFHSFVDVGSGKGLPIFVFLIKELLFQKSETERIAIGVEIVGKKTIISRKLISVFKTLERFVAIDAFESFKESKFFLVAKSFGTEHTKHIADVLKGKSPPILYLNNAATGFDDKSVHGNVVELPKTMSALLCVANLAKCIEIDLFQEFAVQHVSRHMYHIYTRQVC